MVGLSGLEPPTSRLSGVRSNQLSYRPTNFLCSSKDLNVVTSILGLERVMRIELTTSAWKAEVLPLNYTRSYYRKLYFFKSNAILMPYMSLPLLVTQEAYASRQLVAYS